MKRKKFKCYRFNLEDIISSHVLYSALDEIFDSDFLKHFKNIYFKNLSDLLNTVEENSPYTIFNISMVDKFVFLIFKLKEEEKNLL